MEGRTMDKIIIGSDGTEITGKNVSQYLRAFVNDRAGKATRGRVSDADMRLWADMGFPIIHNDPYAATKVAGTKFASRDERALARNWAVENGTLAAGRRGATPNEIVQAWREAGSPVVEVRVEVGHIVAHTKTKSGDWSKGTKRIVAYREEMDKAIEGMALRILAAALTGNDMSPEDVRVTEIHSATGRRWNVDYSDDGIKITPVTALHSLFSEYGE